MHQLSLPENPNETPEDGKAPFLVVKKIREAILDEVFKPGDHLGEVELAERFEVSRSPVREGLLALEKEGTVSIGPYKGAMVRPLSAAEVLDIADLRLALVSLALKPAYRHLSPADFDHAYDLAKRLTRTKNAKEHFEYNRHFWDGIFSKAKFIFGERGWIQRTANFVFKDLQYITVVSCIKSGHQTDLAIVPANLVQLPIN